MPRSQRIVLIAYALLLAYSCVWVPFSVYPRQGNSQYRAFLGYGFVWAGPRLPPAPPDPWAVVSQWPHSQPETAAEQQARREAYWNDRRRSQAEFATPDTERIILRLGAVTGLAVAAFFVVALKGKKPLPPSSKPTAASEPKSDALSPEQRKYERLSPESLKRVVREVKRLEDDGVLQHKSQGYPSLGPEPDENQ